MSDFGIARQMLPYDPNEELANLVGNLEIPHNYLPDIDMHRLRYPTQTKVVDTGIRFDKNTMTHTTSVDKIPQRLLPDYTFVASQMPTRGLTIITEPNKGYVGIEGREVLPSTNTEFKALLLDTLGKTTHFVDDVHPVIKRQLSGK